VRFGGRGPQAGWRRIRAGRSGNGSKLRFRRPGIQIAPVSLAAQHHLTSFALQVQGQRAMSQGLHHDTPRRPPPRNLGSQVRGLTRAGGSGLVFVGLKLGRNVKGIRSCGTASMPINKARRYREQLVKSPWHKTTLHSRGKRGVCANWSVKKGHSGIYGHPMICVTPPRLSSRPPGRLNFSIAQQFLPIAAIRPNRP
jgi:hypothetical protein